MVCDCESHLRPEPPGCPGPMDELVSGVGDAAGLDRRTFLRFTLGSLATLSLPLDLAFGQQELQPGFGRAKACILLWLEGGPSHIDTFDPKLGNGEFRAITTAAPGVELCEHLPRVADQMERIALIRSMSSAEGNHQRARYLVHTGYAPTPTLTHPSIGSIVSSEIGSPQAEIPNFISLQGPSQGAGFLGVSHSPFVIQNPTRRIENLEPPGNVDTARFNSRLALAEQLDAGFRRLHPGADVDAHTTITERTVRFMQSDLARAFDVEEEPESVRDAYGREGFGHGTLMARRLVEAGVPFIEVALRGWDTHEDNFGRTATLCGELDAAFSALIRDLGQRDLLDRVLVVVMGEFGRTPKVNENEGRDHWPQAWSAACAGGGVRGGQVIGATDAEGAEVVSGKLGVPDLIASICHPLGIDHTQWNMSPVGRPLQISDYGNVIPGLFG